MEPDEEVAIKLRHLLTGRIKQAPDGNLTPHDYLLICEESGVAAHGVARGRTTGRQLANPC